MFFSLCVFTWSCKHPKFLSTHKKRMDVSLFVFSCEYWGRFLCLLSCPLLQPCGTVHLLVWDPGSYLPWLWQNSVPVEYNYLWLFFTVLVLSFFHEFTLRKIFGLLTFLMHYLRNTFLCFKAKNWVRASNWHCTNLFSKCNYLSHRWTFLCRKMIFLFIRDVKIAHIILYVLVKVKNVTDKKCVLSLIFLFLCTIVVYFVKYFFRKTDFNWRY